MRLDSNTGRTFTRTKIMATIGPATESEEMVRRLIGAGVDIFRINLSHGSTNQHTGFVRTIRRVEEQLGEPVAICVDLCGPKIRTGPIVGGGVVLEKGHRIVMQTKFEEGNENHFSITVSEVIPDLKAGEMVLIDDGKMRLEVVETNESEAMCEVLVGGVLRSSKGVNLPHTQLQLSALTSKDRQDIQWIAAQPVDFVALSFVQKAEDIQTLRCLLEENDSPAHIIAKIEKPQAVENIDSIIEAADGVMVARGDLGVEMEYPLVPVAQKQITRKCQEQGKPCIIATEMLESMIHSPTPTRADVSDVANAVLDHADAIMLSAESAIGDYPVEAVEMMDRTATQAQLWLDHQRGIRQNVVRRPDVAAAIANAVNEIIDQAGISLAAVFTMTGSTALMIAKNRPACPVLALSPKIQTVRRVCLYYGMIPRLVAPLKNTEDILSVASKMAAELGLAAPGDNILIVSGRPIGIPGRTNAIVVHPVEEV